MIKLIIGGGGGGSGLGVEREDSSERCLKWSGGVRGETEVVTTPES